MPLPVLPCLMLVTDRRLCGGAEALVSVVEKAVAGGVNAVQLREKDLPPEKLLPLAMRLREVTAGRALLLVNGSLEVALAARADGLHLPEGAPIVQRPDRPFLLGRSVHSREAAVRAWEECTDYLIAGPVYPTGSHPNVASGGARLIEDVSRAVAIPALGIGGITAERADEVITAGASGVAVMRAILEAPSAQAASRGLQEVLERAWAETGALRR